MKLTIDIPEETYQDVVKNGFIYDEDGEVISHVIMNGIPLNDVTTFKENVLDAISRIGLLKSDTKEVQAIAECLRAVEALAPVNPQESYDFAKWVASEIFDEWEYNKDAFAELACRKLAKLGIVRAKGDEWELVEQEEERDEE